MATDIKISELNEITANSDINYIIVNDRENTADEGITKKIRLENFLTPNIVLENNILNSAVTNDKIQDLAVDCSKIANNTITCNQILGCTINNPSLDSNSVDNRVLNNCCNFTVQGLLVNTNCINISNPTTGCLSIASGVTTLGPIKYNWPQQQVANKFLKTDGAGNLTWTEAVPGESTALVFSEIMPVGTIIPWGGIGDTPSGKWLPCDGSLRDGPTYPELSAALGTSWGAYVGNDFRLPDLRGRVTLGTGDNINDGTNPAQTFAFGTYGGKFRHQLTALQSGLRAHKHVVGITFNDSGTDLSLYGWCNLLGSEYTSDRSSKTDATGERSPYTQTVGGVDADESHNNIQPYAVTKYIIKAKPDDIEQFNPVITPGLSAKNAGGQQANITLNTIEIGLKVTEDFQFDGSGRLTLNDNVSASSITFDDDTVLTTGEQTAFYGVTVSNINNRTTPAQMRADRATANFYGAWDEYSKGLINTGYDNSGYPSTNSLMYTMHVNVLQNTTITMYNFNNDDYFYIYQDDVLKYTGSNYGSPTPRVVTFNLTAGIRRIDIVKNDTGGSNSFELMGNIIGTNVRFISGY